MSAHQLVADVEKREKESWQVVLGDLVLAFFRWAWPIWFNPVEVVPELGRGTGVDNIILN